MYIYGEGNIRTYIAGAKRAGYDRRDARVQPALARDGLRGLRSRPGYEPQLLAIS